MVKRLHSPGEYPEGYRLFLKATGALLADSRIILSLNISTYTHSEQC